MSEHDPKRRSRDELNADSLFASQRELSKRVTSTEERLDTTERRVEQLEDRVPTPPMLPPRPPPRPAPPPSVAIAMSHHRDAASDAKRMASDAELTFQSTVGAIIAHNRTLETAVADLRRDRLEADDAQNAALLLISRELGIEDRLPPKIQKSIRPPPPGIASGGKSAPVPGPVLRRLDHRAKSSQIVQFVIAVSVIADLLRQLIFSHR